MAELCRSPTDSNLILINDQTDLRKTLTGNRIDFVSRLNIFFFFHSCRSVRNGCKDSPISSRNKQHARRATIF